MVAHKFWPLQSRKRQAVIEIQATLSQSYYTYLTNWDVNYGTKLTSELNHFFNLFLKIMNFEHKAEKHICSICNKEYEGYGKLSL